MQAPPVGTVGLIRRAVGRDISPDLEAVMVAPSFGRRLFGYLSLCFFEAFLVAALIYLDFAVIMPAAVGGGDGAHACAAIGFLLLGPIFWAGGVLFCLAAKVVVLLMPPAHRHWSLAVYWGATAAIVAWTSYRDGHSPRSDAAGSDLFILITLLYLIPALVLTFSHFVLLPRIAPGSGTSALSAIFRRRPAPQEPTS
jgi:hypothetical protein